MNPLLLILVFGGALGYLLSRRTPRGEVTITDYTGNSSFFGGVVESVSKLNKPVGVRNHNPGNLRYIANDPWDGQVGNDSGYGIYDTDARGLRAMAKQIAKHVRRGGKDTVRKLIETYAPPHENPTEAYIRNVAGALGLPLIGNPPDTPTFTLDRVTLFQLMRAMIVQEQGKAWAVYYSDADVRTAVNEAFV